ncbi:MAG TPA: hypothetical protein VKO18_10875 [Terriglobia bacterium]|nr:hypothetical protein [Terriglobia bacterium]
MRFVTKTSWILGILVFVAPLAAPKAAMEVEPGSLVIVFKDGRQQSFRLANIARIEFGSPAEKASAGQARFLGEWKVGDGNGGTFLITLKPDGVAHKTLGSESGMWTAMNGEPHIAWDDGWHDIIRKVGSKYEKAAYSPGSSLSGPPSNVAEAVYTEAH